MFFTAADFVHIESKVRGLRLRERVHRGEEKKTKKRELSGSECFFIWFIPVAFENRMIPLCRYIWNGF